jgi:hypothetical protein
MPLALNLACQNLAEILKSEKDHSRATRRMSASRIRARAKSRISPRTDKDKPPLAALFDPADPTGTTLCLSLSVAMVRLATLTVDPNLLLRAVISVMAVGRNRAHTVSVAPRGSASVAGDYADGAEAVVALNAAAGAGADGGPANQDSRGSANGTSNGDKRKNVRSQRTQSDDTDQYIKPDPTANDSDDEEPALPQRGQKGQGTSQALISTSPDGVGSGDQPQSRPQSSTALSPQLARGYTEPLADNSKECVFFAVWSIA